jgi:hypothetical protein
MTDPRTDLTVPVAEQRLGEVAADIDAAGAEWTAAAGRAGALAARVAAAPWTTTAITEVFTGLADRVGTRAAVQDEVTAMRESLASAGRALTDAITTVGVPAAAAGAQGDATDFTADTPAHGPLRRDNEETMNSGVHPTDGTGITVRLTEQQMDVIRRAAALNGGATDLPTAVAELAAQAATTRLTAAAEGAARPARHAGEADGARALTDPLTVLVDHDAEHLLQYLAGLDIPQLQALVRRYGVGPRPSAAALRDADRLTTIVFDRTIQRATKGTALR